MCLCIHVFMCMFMCMFICLCVCLCVCLFVVCMCVCACVCVWYVRMCVMKVLIFSLSIITQETSAIHKRSSASSTTPTQTPEKGTSKHEPKAKRRRVTNRDEILIIDP